MTPGQMIERYLQLRARIQDEEAAHKKNMAPLVELRVQLEGALLNYLNENEIDSTRSDLGTAFRSTATSVSVKDWRATLEYIQKHQLWELLEARVSKAATLEVMAEKDELIPGVDVSRVSVLRVRQN